MATTPDFSMKTLRYKRNWAYEDMMDVHFLDGSIEPCFGQTDNKGQINFIVYDGKRITPDEFGVHEIASVHFTTPAKLEVKVPTPVLVVVYLRLGQTIGECDDALEVARIRSQIAEEIGKRGVNIHEAMAAHTANQIESISNTP